MKMENKNQPIPAWRNQFQTENKVMQRLRESPLLYSDYQRLNPEWKQRFLDFCQGKKSLPLTYDPFFKRIFHPDVHPDRLSRLVSSLLGLEIELLQEYCLISLDVFRKFPYPKIRSEQTAWLSLLTTESLTDAEKLVREYPWLEEIYIEIAMLRQQPEEVLGMFSEALKILDQNTVKYMIEELQKKVEERDTALEILATEKNAVIERQKAEIEALKKQLAEHA